MLQAQTLDIIKRSASIPSMPIVAARCYEMTQDPDCDYRDLVDLLTTDPGMAADLLRISNSALFGRPRKIGSLKQAITLLGIKRIRELVLARYLVQKLSEFSVPSLDITYFWRRSLLTAILAQRLTHALNPAAQDEAFIAGLLADIGILVLARALPAQYDPLASQYKPHGGDQWRSTELELLGLSHAEISALVLDQWNLPPNIVAAVRDSEAPFSDNPPNPETPTLARLIAVAASIARKLCEADDAHSALESAAASLETYGLNPDLLPTVLIRLEEELSRMADLLHIELLDTRLVADLDARLVADLDARLAEAAVPVLA